jgi:hypothetical protein
MSIARPIAGYRGFVEICRQRAEELAISRLEIDRLAGLPSGYSSKLLGRDGAGPKKKRLWPIGMEALLGVLGLQILVIEDPAATARTLALREPVDTRQQRIGNVCRLSAKLLPAPQPSNPATLTIVVAKRRGCRKYG